VMETAREEGMEAERKNTEKEKKRAEKAEKETKKEKERAEKAEKEKDLSIRKMIQVGKLTAEEIANVFGVSVDYVNRFK